jgi:hypothetical protein
MNCPQCGVRFVLTPQGEPVLPPVEVLAFGPKEGEPGETPREALVLRALEMYANWVETRDPLMSAEDVKDQAATRGDDPRLVKLGDTQVALFFRLRRMALEHLMGKVSS